MKIFDRPNMSGFCCPICKTSANRPVVLVGIPGTEDGNIQQATQVHAECYELFEKMCEIERNDKTIKIEML